MESFEGRVAAVTGGASGIGRALCVALAREGCAIAACDIDRDGLDETARMAEIAGAKVTTALVDVADRSAMHAWADAVVAEHGAVHLVFNNAGVALEANVIDMAYEDLEWLMNINYWGVVHGTKAFLPHLVASGAGHVVNVSSVFGIIGVPTQSAYNSAKFAVRGFTEALRQELEIEGLPVSATSVHPGGIRTNIVRGGRLSSEQDREEAAARFEASARTSPERAAEIILRAVRKNERRVLVGPDAWLIDRLQRWLPSAYQRLISWGVRRGRDA